MKNRHNEGFSLVETLVSITILALIVIPVCSGLIMSFRMNAKTNSLMQAQLAVSSAVETLMAEGIEKGTPNTASDGDYGLVGTVDRFPDVKIQVTNKDAGQYYEVLVTSVSEPDVSVLTNIRAVPSAGGGA